MTTNRDRSSYDRLCERFRRIAALEDAMSVLSWDQQTVMPKGGGLARAEQMATLRVLRHEAVTAREHAHATALTSALVDARSRAAAACETAWLTARPASRFKSVAKPLDALVRLVREVAEVKAEALGKSPYDALLDQFEPDGSSEAIDALFGRLEPALAGLLPLVLERQAGRASGPVMATLGFEFEHGRLDISAHPFSGGVPDDVRITTRYDTADWSGSLMGVIHETGHALYERGLPKKWRGQPVGSARGMTLHESQSLLMEMQAARSRPFFDHLAPMLRKSFGVKGSGWSPAALYRGATRVARSFIRVEADEVTYPFHVMLRYRLERALLSGDLPVADLPGAWNDGMEKTLGIRPPDDRRGCLQDIHWYDGAFGYFPTYTMGALAAAQLYAAAGKALPDRDENVARGDFAPLLAWLRKNVHRWGSYHDTDSVLKKATGKPLDEQAFLRHIRTRYLDA
jgi:carboxypeptidase Taq